MSSQPERGDAASQEITAASSIERHLPLKEIYGDVAKDVHPLS
jgi:hypothetical protein